MTTHPIEGADDVALDAIHSLMWRRRISQTEMALTVGVSQSTFSKKLRGLVPLTLTEFCTIAARLGVDPAELFERARRDSNPKPSDWEPTDSVGARRLSPEGIPMRAPTAFSLVRGGLTGDRPGQSTTTLHLVESA